MNVVYRLCSAAYPAHSGAGARQYGGRWNPRGIEVIYSSATASLAALEILANNSVLPRNYALTEIQIPEGLVIERVSGDQLPDGWDDLAIQPETQEFGARWIEESRSPVLSVPSSIIRTERNFLINPAHQDFSVIVFLAPQRFEFDPRLK